MPLTTGSELNRGRVGSAGGFTLIELMLAVSVMLIAIMAAFSSQLSSMNLLRASRESNTAMTDLQTAMEEVLLQPIDNIPAAGFYPSGQPIAAYTNLNLPTETITPTYPTFGGLGPVPDPLEIVLTMTWQDWRGRPMTAQLATVKAR
jgi:prepilin-type N-terminal cleavage/methylation domain-containing protein